MGAAGLVDIKRRIKSVESTRKITNAMGVVATSKLRKCRKELSTNDIYFKAAEETIKSLVAIANESEDLEFPYFSPKKSDSKLYIVITSDTGLCGGYNNNIVSYLSYLVKDDKDKAKVITIGAKGIPYVKRAGFNSVAEYVDIPNIPTTKEVKVIYEKAVSLFNSGEVSEVYVVYTNFISPVKQIPRIEKLLPIDRLEGEGQAKIVEPSLDIVLKDALDAYLKGKLRYLILNAKCSEESARMTAMDGATSNANDLLASLNLKYNRIRQTMITQEISEIVGGASAQK